MRCYLNRGIILEQAIVAIINEYLKTMKINEIYQNNQIHVVLNDHFTKLHHEQGGRSADNFPAIVVSSLDDVKDKDLSSMRPQTASWIGYKKTDIESIVDIYVPGSEGNQIVPGICVVAADESINALFEKLEKNKNVYGFSTRFYRREIISIDIMAENIQLKNELYEQIRFFVLGDLRNKLIEKYSFFDLRLDDDTVKGQRVLPFLVDHGLTLAGANVQFEVAYAIEQNVLDTEWEDVHKEIIIGGRTYVG